MRSRSNDLSPHSKCNVFQYRGYNRRRCIRCLRGALQLLEKEETPFSEIVPNTLVAHVRRAGKVGGGMCTANEGLARVHLEPDAPFRATFCQSVLNGPLCALANTQTGRYHVGDDLLGASLPALASALLRRTLPASREGRRSAGPAGPRRGTRARRTSRPGRGSGTTACQDCGQGRDGARH